MPIFLCVVFVFFIFFSTDHVKADNDVSASVITFKNFNKNINLHKEGDYYRTEDDLLVKLNDQLLIKTDKSIVLHDLVSSHNKIIDGSEVFVAREFNYYLVRITKDSNVGVMINTLLSLPGILLVQPDLLQIAYKAQDKNKKTSGVNVGRADAKLSSRGKPVFAHSSEFHIANKPNLEKKAKRTKRIYEAYLSKLGVPELWKSSQGKGVRIAIIDDGIELRHPALVHVNKTLIYDVDSHVTTLDAMATGADHGTQIAGVIFSAHDSGISNNIRGLAPGASLIALRNPSTRTSKTLLAFQLAMLANADIINCSWNTHRLLQPIADAVNELAKHGREGKGTAIIFAAGNDGMEIENQRVEASLDAALVVAASNPRGKRLLSSNYGESVDLLVYGRGVHSTAGKEEYKVFAGTSLAAAITTGLAAITLATNHDLTLKQLQAQLVSITSH